jgi:signal transduction histidine kinase
MEDRHDHLSSDERYYRTLYDLSPDLILTLGSDHRVEDVNRRGAQALSEDYGQVIGKELVSLLDQPSGASLMGLLSTGFEGVGESHIHLRDGRRMNFSVARLDADRTIVVLRDVTQGYLIAAKLEDARRLSSVGRMAGALAQEITNPLSVIHGRVEVLQAMRQIKPADLQRQLAIMADHCGRIAGLVRNLQTLAVPPSIHRKWLPLDELIEQAISQAGRRLRRVQIETQMGPVRIRIYVDPKLFVQLLASLLCFAGEHSPPGSVLELSAEQNDQDGVCIQVRGAGMPISPEVMAELERQERQHSIEPGMGLGLTVVSSIVQDHGGRLRLESHPSGGNLYIVELPGMNLSSMQSEDRDRRILRVLVVDDDALLCETVKWMLSVDGHRITDVRSAEEALVRLQTESFDVIIVDMRLPQMTGLELLAAMEGKWPGQASRVILTSGMLEDPERAYPYLQKPFTRQDLIDAIDQVMA